MSYVYLMRHATKPIFKIGKSETPYLRSRAFKEDIDFKNSLQIYLAHVSSDFEKGLHALFKNYRLPPISSEDGATEWFKNECWERCLAFFEQNNDLLGVVPEPILWTDQTDKILLTKEERAERRRANEKLEQLKINQENKNLLAQWEAFLPWLAAQEIISEFVNAHGQLEISIPPIPNESFKFFCQSKIGRSGLVTKNGAYLCGIESIGWREDGEDIKNITITFRQFSVDRFEQMKNSIDQNLYARFEAMNAWIAARKQNASAI